MSRTVSAALQTAAAHASAYSPIAKARVDRSRTYFSSFTDTTGWGGGEQAAGILSSPIPQDVTYSPSESLLVTVLLDSAYNLYAARSGTAAQVEVKEGAVPLISQEGCKPSVREGYVYYLSVSGNLIRAAADMTKLGDVADCITAQENIDIGITDLGSVHAITDDIVMFVRLDEGGLRSTLYVRAGGPGWDEYESPFRFMSPEKAVVSSYWTVDTAACVLDNKYFVYFSDWKRGSIWGHYICYDASNEFWSDYFEVVPEDLSETRVINALAVNSTVFLFVQFARKEEWATGETYNMALRSKTGLRFSLDRMTLFSALGNRISGVLYGDTLYYVSDNSYYSESLTYWYDASDPVGVDIPGSKIIEVQVSDNNEGGLVLADADDTYSDNSLIARGSRLTLYMGYKTSAGSEYVKVSTHIIISVDKRRFDAKGPLTLRLKSVGVFFMQDMSSPFYAEILGQSSYYDDCSELKNLYIAPNSGHAETGFSVDFWGATGFDPDGVTTEVNIINNGGVDPRTTSGSHREGFKTKRIKDQLYLAKDPVALGSVVVSLYGWARTEAGGQVDAVDCYIVKENELGNEVIVKGTRMSTYKKFPEYYVNNRAGSYPITWSVAVVEGDKILHLGFVFERDVSTVYCPEIAYVSNTTISYRTQNANTPWKKVSIVNNPDITELEVPSIGVPHVMFSATPYSAFNFDQEADFYLQGDGGSDGVTEVGLVGHAEDALNMTFCRYIQQSGDWEIVKLRGGEETVLASTTSAVSEDMWMRFTHRDGVFRVFAGATPEWGDPVLSYTWQAVDGALATNILNMHVGIRGAVLPVSFRIAGFNVADADGIPLAGNEDYTVLNSLGASGELQIGNSIYSYTGKTALGRPVGPYQGRSTWNWYAYDNGNGSFSGLATDITFYQPDNNKTDYQDYLLAADNGHTWKITETEWDAWTKTAGVIIQLRNRSRHFGDSVHGQIVGASNRVCISPGVLSPVLVDGPGGLHTYGTFAYAIIDHKIRVRTYQASDGRHDTNVRNMLEMAAEMSGAEVLFPGDTEIASEALSAGVYSTVYP
jgi:hypothetical protein